MKTGKIILLCTCISFAVLSAMLVLVVDASVKPNLTYGSDSYSGTLGAQGSMTDCFYTGQAPYYKTYDTSYLGLTPYINSASPSGWSLYVGYCTTDFSYSNVVLRTTPGSGPSPSSFPVYGIYGNSGSVSENWQGHIQWLNRA
jgi:hypothetical protein